MQNNMVELELKIESLIDRWPKKRSALTKAYEKEELLELIKTEEDFQNVFNSFEVKLEDTKAVKLPGLVVFIRGLLSKNENQTSLPEEKETKSVVLTKVFNPNKEIEKAFNEIWDQWPKNPDFVERRQNALNAFIQAANTIGLEQLKTSCQTYVMNFNDASGVYAKTLKNFVSDKELVEYYLELTKHTENREYEKACFETAYAWYPEFTGKNSPKTKDASWVVYWRNIADTERIDFLAHVRAYRLKRKYVDEEHNYTKSFQNFVNEWRHAAEYDILTKREIMEGKDSVGGWFLVKLLLENGLDVENIWGGHYMSFFTESAMKCLYMQGYSFKDALFYMLSKAPEEVKERWDAKDPLYKMRDRELAKQQMIGFDPKALTEKVYNEFIKIKLFEMPPVIKTNTETQ